MNPPRLPRVLASLIAAALLAACEPTRIVETTADHEHVRIGAFDFPESLLLAELYAQALERNGVPVERVGTIGSREVVQPALQQGAVDLVPEYLGSALHFAAIARSVDVDEVSQQALDEVLAPVGLSALPEADAHNSNAFVVRRGSAHAGAPRRLSDLAAATDDLVVGGPPECQERRSCLLGLSEVYGIRPLGFLPLRDADAVVAALDAGEIDVGVLFTTDPQLSSTTHLVLDDDRGLQAPEHVVPVVRDEVLVAFPVMERTLTELGDELTTSALRELNRIVQVERRPVGEAVDDWLDARARRLVGGVTP